MSNLPKRITGFRDAYLGQLKTWSQEVGENELDEILRVMVASRKESDEIGICLKREGGANGERKRWEELAGEVSLYLEKIEARLKEVRTLAGQGLGKLDRGQHGLKGYRSATERTSQPRVNEEI